MNTSKGFLPLTAGVVLVSVLAGVGTGVCAWGAEQDARALRRLFADPPREYASAPLWVWNDLLTPGQVQDTMRDLEIGRA